MGGLIGLVIRVFLMWLRNRFDPDMIRLRDLKAIRSAKEEDLAAIDRAVADDDVVAISTLWQRLQR